MKAAGGRHVQSSCPWLRRGPRNETLKIGLETVDHAVTLAPVLSRQGNAISILYIVSSLTGATNGSRKNVVINAASNPSLTVALH